MDAFSVHLISTYSTYVEHGHTPLLAMPSWTVDVAEIVARARAEAAQQREREDEQAEKAARLLSQAIQEAAWKKH